MREKGEARKNCSMYHCTAKVHNKICALSSQNCKRNILHSIHIV